MERRGSERIAYHLTWQAAVRQDLGVARLLLDGASPDCTYGLGGGGLVDHFFGWMRELGILDRMARLKGARVVRQSIPFEMFVLVYFPRCLARIPSQESLFDLLFEDQALMRRVGFNAHQLACGVAQRGRSRRAGVRRNLPVDPDAVSKNAVVVTREDGRAASDMVLLTNGPVQQPSPPSTTMTTMTSAAGSRTRDTANSSRAGSSIGPCSERPRPRTFTSCSCCSPSP